MIPILSIIINCVELPLNRELLKRQIKPLRRIDISHQIIVGPKEFSYLTEGEEPPQLKLAESRINQDGFRPVTTVFEHQR